MKTEDKLLWNTIWIVTYMEWEIEGSGDNRYVKSYLLPEPYRNMMNANHRLLDMKFHNDWNWLMPVIESCSKFQYQDGDTSYPRTFGLFDYGTKLFMFRYNRYALHSCEKLINAAYNATIEWLIGCFDKHGE